MIPSLPDGGKLAQALVALGAATAALALSLGLASAAAASVTGYEATAEGHAIAANASAPASVSAYDTAAYACDAPAVVVAERNDDVRARFAVGARSRVAGGV